MVLGTIWELYMDHSCTLLQVRLVSYLFLGNHFPVLLSPLGIGDGSASFFSQLIALLDSLHAYRLGPIHYWAIGLDGDSPTPHIHI